MPLFKYKAIDSKGGKTLEILIEGDSQDDSLSRLRGRGLTPISYMGRVDNREGGMMSFMRGGKSFDAAEFTNRLIPLLKAQIQLEKALFILSETSEDEATRDLVVNLRRGLHEGKKFSAMIRDRGNLFPPVYANMVEAGEESGALTKVMVELQTFLNERKEMKNFLITSMIYPVVILAVTAGVIIMLFTFFIPKFTKIFMDMGKELPTPTRMMLGLSNIVAHPVSIIIALLALAGIAYLVTQIRKGGPAKDWWDRTVLDIPLMGSIIKTVEIARFIRTMAVLLQSYVPILNSVVISEKVIQNRRIRDTLAGVNTELRGGAKLSAALAKSPFISRTVVQMLSIGEETGNMGEMLNETASYYETELKYRIKRLLALFEPAVILILSVVVFGVVASIFLALLELNEL